jgi:hypothetical protein
MRLSPAPLQVVQCFTSPISNEQTASDAWRTSLPKAASDFAYLNGCLFHSASSQRHEGPEEKKDRAISGPVPVLKPWADYLATFPFLARAADP